MLEVLSFTERILPGYEEPLVCALCWTCEFTIHCQISIVHRSSPSLTSSKTIANCNIIVTVIVTLRKAFLRLQFGRQVALDKFANGMRLEVRKTVGSRKTLEHSVLLDLMEVQNIWIHLLPRIPGVFRNILSILRVDEFPELYSRTLLVNANGDSPQLTVTYSSRLRCDRP